MNRRVFTDSLLKTSVATFISLRFARHVFADALPSSLYANAIVIDSLCAPCTDMETSPSAETLAAVRKSGITAVNCTVSDFSYEDTIESLAALQDLVDRNPDIFLIVRRHSDIARAKRESKIGIMPGFQYTSFLEEKPERIATFRRLGVRIINSHTTTAAVSVKVVLSREMRALARQALRSSSG